MCGQGRQSSYGSWTAWDACGTDLIETLHILKDRSVDFLNVTENIDTTTPGGKLIFHLMGALAEFERDLRSPRTNAGLAAARARGCIGGRPKRLATNGKVALARQLFTDPNHSLPEICSTLGISRSTLYRYMKDTKKASDPPAEFDTNLPLSFGMYIQEFWNRELRWYQTVSTASHHL